jgi:hypothetical protein
MAKARIRKNRYDNWYGYLGTRRVIAFPNTIPNYGAEQAAKEWLTAQTTLTPRQVRIQEIQNALKAGAGVFTGTLTNELENLRREEGSSNSNG